MPRRDWARASAASTSAQRARKASSPNTARIAAVPNMSPKRVEESMPIVMSYNLNTLARTDPQTGIQEPRFPTVGSKLGAARRHGMAKSSLPFVSSWSILGEREPISLGQALECGEARLVGHLGAVGDPVAEVDVGQARAATFLDQP